MDHDDPDNGSLRWWQRARWLAALAALIAAMSFAAFTTNTVATRNKVEQTGSVAVDNQATLERIDRALSGIEANQQGIDELVSFVRDLQSQPQGNSDAVQQVIDLLCASEDPVRLEACRNLKR